MERASLGLVYFGKVGRGERSPVRMLDPWNSENTIPLSFREAKASCLFNLSLELFDLESIQLLGSHVHEVKQLFYIDDSIDALIVDNHFMNALAHLLSSPTANPKVGQSLTLLTLIGIDQTINDQG